MEFTEKDDRRFRNKYTEGKPDECWVWNAAHTTFGYGVFYVDGKQRLAHRVAYEVWVGPIPDGQNLLHSCDNPPCINPLHLSPGSQADNLQDAARKNRTTFGERNARAKLTRQNVEEMRALYAARAVSAKELAERYGVNDVYVYNVLSGKTWRTEGSPVTRRRESAYKLTAEDVIEIRRLWDNGELTQPQLSKRYNVKRCQINRIVHRKAWLSV